MKEKTGTCAIPLQMFDFLLYIGEFFLKNFSCLAIYLTHTHTHSRTHTYTYIYMYIYIYIYIYIYTHTQTRRYTDSIHADTCTHSERRWVIAKGEICNAYKQQEAVRCLGVECGKLRDGFGRAILTHKIWRRRLSRQRRRPRRGKRLTASGDADRRRREVE